MASKDKRITKPSAEDSKYKATAQDRDVIRKSLAKIRAGRSARIKITNDGGVPAVAPDHPDLAIGYAYFMEALATDNFDFIDGIISQLTNAGSQGGKVSEQNVNFMLAVIKGIAPRDQVETLLAAQMAAVHMATMTSARHLAHVENVAQQDSAERTFNKLARTFTTQVEALKRYRTGGEQKVTVQHVSVSEGGQAIVGIVTQAPSENTPGNAPASTTALTDAKTAPMPIIDNSQEPAPVSSRRKRVK